LRRETKEEKGNKFVALPPHVRCGLTLPCDSKSPYYLASLGSVMWWCDEVLRVLYSNFMVVRTLFPLGMRKTLVHLPQEASWQSIVLFHSVMLYLHYDVISTA